MTLGAPKTARPFCAICTDDIVGEPIRSPLGKDDAMVDVCAACDGDRAIATRGPDVEYDRDENSAGWLEFRRRIDRFATTHKIAKVEPYSVVTKRLTPGWLMVRVPANAPNGRRRDMVEAFETIAHEPWAGEVGWLGAVGNLLLFERPDPAVASKDLGPSRNKTSADVRYWR